MRIDIGAIEAGMEAAEIRTRERFQVERRQLDGGYSRLIGVLNGWPEEAHPRFITLFAELWAVAETVRIVNQEPPLSEPQIGAFLGHCAAYFNSFKHE